MIASFPKQRTQQRMYEGLAASAGIQIPQAAACPKMKVRSTPRSKLRDTMDDLRKADGELDQAMNALDDAMAALASVGHHLFYKARDDTRSAVLDEEEFWRLDLPRTL